MDVLDTIVLDHVADDGMVVPRGRHRQRCHLALGEHHILPKRAPAHLPATHCIRMQSTEGRRAHDAGTQPDELPAALDRGVLVARGGQLAEPVQEEHHPSPLLDRAHAPA